MTLQSDSHRKILLFCNFIGSQYSANTRPVNGNWLFHKYVLARLNGSFEMHRTETRRRGQNDQVRIAVQNLLVRIEANEATLFWNVTFVGML